MVSMQGPVVTIVVPVYNAEDTILECLQSIKAQTWSALNVLLVDDGSTDHSYARIADCIATDSRFTLIPPPPPLSGKRGPAATRNTGIRHAVGDFLYFVDADDLIEPRAIETMVRLYQTQTVELVCGGHTQIRGSGPHVLKDGGLDRDTRLSRQALIGYVQHYLRVPYHYVLLVHCWNKLYDLRIVRERGIFFDTRLTQLEDVHFNFRYLCHVDAVFCSRSFNYHHRISSDIGSLSSEAGTEPNAVQNCMTAFSPIGDFLDRMDVEGTVDRRRELGHHFVTTALIYIIRLTRRFVTRPSIERYRNIECWVASSVFLDNIHHYRRQRGESRVVLLALRTCSAPVILMAAMWQLLVVRVTRGLRCH